MGVHVDDSDAKQLIRDLEDAPAENRRRDRVTMRRGAVEIKRGMRRDFSGHSHAPYISRAVNYDRIGDLGYEIGVDKDGPQGGLGNLLAFGSSHNAPVVDHTAALTRQLPVIEKNLGDNAVAPIAGIG